MTDHEIHALSGAYAIDALDPEERARFVEHLAACSSCQSEVASLQEAAAVLGEAAATAPPAGLRDRVLAEVGSVRPLPPPVPADRAPGLRRWAAPLIAAAAVLAVAVGGTVVWDQARDSSSSQLTRAEQVVQARDADQVSVDLPGGASATVYLSRAQNRVALVTRHLPAAPAGRVYQLWLQKNGRMVPAGLMPRGSDQTRLFDGVLAGATAAGITVEPAGGSQEPTTAAIALFEFKEAT
jgi:anti-sigma-K factor RskA